MSSSLAQKLKIRENSTLRSLNAPADFVKALKNLPSGVKLVSSGNQFDQLHWFVKTKAQLENEISKVMKMLKPGLIVWTYFPKASSGIQTDLTRDKGWDNLEAEKDRLSRIGLISFNDTWSVFGFRSKAETDKKKATQIKTREIFNWVDPQSRKVRLPEDLSRAFKLNKKQGAFFETLSFTNKKEWIEWIVTAKREETKNKRIVETINRLGKGWRNPSNS